MPDTTPQDPETVGRFLRLFSEHHNRLLGYILGMVHDRTEADEVFQESSLILWREFHTFRADAPFLPWARAICFNRVREHRRRRAKTKAMFSDSMLETLAAHTEQRADTHNARAEALNACIEQLNERDRDLVRLYYREGETAESVSRQVGRSVHAIYKAIKRIRRALFECTDRTLTAEARP